MGESKRREEKSTPFEQVLTELSRKLTDEGKLIEAGFVGMRLAAIPEGASPEQVEDMRKAFMAGAQHLYSSIMTILDPGGEPTSADLRRMQLIDEELRVFGAQLLVDLYTEGHA